MAKNTVNPFAQAQEKREAEQAKIKQNLGMKTAKVEATAPSKRKVRLDVTVPADTKQKLLDYAENKGLSASVVVQMLIDEQCV